MKAYVAGPDVFREDAREHLEEVRELLSRYDITALIPLDNDETLDFSDRVGTAAKIYKANLKMIEAADVVLANIQPFRGDHMDPGTAFEIGYAVALGKPVHVYTTYAGSRLVERIEGVFKDGCHFDQSGMLIEDFDMTENLMITVPASSISETIEDAILSIKREARLRVVPDDEI